MSVLRRSSRPCARPAPRGTSRARGAGLRKTDAHVRRGIAAPSPRTIRGGTDALAHHRSGFAAGHGSARHRDGSDGVRPGRLGRARLGRACIGRAGGSAAPGALAAPTTIAPGTLTDCVDIEYPPMEYFPSADVTDPNQAIGFDVDAARAVATALGLTLEITAARSTRSIPTSRPVAATSSGPALYINEERLAGRRRRAVHGDRPRGHGPDGQPRRHRSAERPLRQDGLHPGRRPRRGAHQRAEHGSARRTASAITIQGYPESPTSSSRSCSAAWTRSGRPTPPCRTGWSEPGPVRGRLLAAARRHLRHLLPEGQRPSRGRARGRCRGAEGGRHARRRSRASTRSTRPRSTSSE